jgi:hypothetical protein
MKDETEIQDGVQSIKKFIFGRQTDGNLFLVKNHFFIHKKF